MSRAQLGQSGGAAAVLPKSFDAEFNNKSPGDIILVAIDDKPDLGYYFRFALLAEISTFFSTLPPPSPTDLVDGGTALIPLHGIQSNGLYLLLKAIQSIHSPEPFGLEWGFRTGHVEDALLEATVVAKVYQIPIVYRILVEYLRRDHRIYDHYIEFAIWAIAGVETMLPDAARATLEDGEVEITEVDRDLVDICKAHALVPWLNLLDLHLRYRRAPALFHHKVRMRLASTNRYNIHAGCAEAMGLVERVRQQLLGSQTIKGIKAVKQKDYGVQCRSCLMMVKDRCDPLVNWIEDFGLAYIRSNPGDF